MKNARIWLFLAGLVALLLILTCLFSASALAAGPTYLWVNGVDILTTPGHTINCGNGKATYDEHTQTLTLENAEITGNSIEIFGGDLTIVLVGSNVITQRYLYGIYSRNTVTITGNGTLRIASLDDCMMVGRVVVDGATLHLEQERYYSFGIYAYTQAGDESITLQNRANVTIVSNIHSGWMRANHNIRIVEGSTLTLKGSFALDQGIWTQQNLEIDSSTVTATLESENAGVALNAWENVSITNSHVTLQSNGRDASILGREVTVKGSTVSITAENGRGIKAMGGKITIADQSEVTAMGNTEEAVIVAGSDIAIQNSKVMATNQGKGRALYSQEKVTIADQSEVTAMGNTGDVVFSADSDIAIQNSTFTATNQGEGPALFSEGKLSVSDGSTVTAIAKRTGVPAILAYWGVTVADSSELTADGGILTAENGVSVRPAPGGHMRVHATRHQGGAAEMDQCYGMEKNFPSDDELSRYRYVHIKQHAHTPGQAWERDDNNHWHICTACGTKADEQAHTPGAWGRDDNGHWHACAVCGAKTGEQPHAFAQSWTPGETGHWHECPCGAKQGEEAHTPGEAWAHGDASHWHVCTACGARMDEEAHTPGAWGRDDNGHWHACAVCGAKTGEQSHAFAQSWTPGETGHWHECPCGAKADEQPHTPGETWGHGDASHWHVCTACGARMDVQPHTYEWVTDKQPGSGVPGSKHEQCTVCGRAKPPLPIPALPQTGDGAPIALWLLLLLASGMAIAALLVVRINRKR